jgi:hypothetical protein
MFVTRRKLDCSRHPYLSHIAVVRLVQLPEVPSLRSHFAITTTVRW